MTILHILNTLAILIELAYDMGAATRKYVWPVVVYIAVAVYHYGGIAYDWCCDQLDYELKVYNTPITTGLAF